MVGRGDHHQGVQPDGFIVDIQPVGRTSHQVDIVQTQLQALEQGLARQDQQARFNAGMHLAELAHHGRQQVFRRGNCSHRQAATFDALAGGQPLLQQAQLGVNPARGLKRIQPRLGQAQAPAADLMQRQAQHIGQLTELNRDRRRGQVQTQRRPGNRAFLGDHPENAQLMQG